jgi:DNA-binding CsgD family transcriptional regulator
VGEGKSSAAVQAGEPMRSGGAVLVSRQLPNLTERQRRVLELIAAGLSSREIASRLWVSIKDIDFHVSSLIRKFEATNRTGMVSRAFVLGYISVQAWPPIVHSLPEP